MNTSIRLSNPQRNLLLHEVRRSTDSNRRLRAHIRLLLNDDVLDLCWDQRTHSVRKKLRKIRALLRDLPGDEMAVFQDEVDINTNPKISSMWMWRGQQAKSCHRAPTANATWPVR